MTRPELSESVAIRRELEAHGYDGRDGDPGTIKSATTADILRVGELVNRGGGTVEANRRKFGEDVLSISRYSLGIREVDGVPFHRDPLYVYNDPLYGDYDDLEAQDYYRVSDIRELVLGSASSGAKIEFTHPVAGVFDAEFVPGRRESIVYKGIFTALGTKALHHPDFRRTVWGEAGVSLADFLSNNSEPVE